MTEDGRVADAKSIVGLLRLARILGPSGPGAEPEPGAERLATASWRMSMRRMIWASIALAQASRGMQVFGGLFIAFGLVTYLTGADIGVWGVPVVFGATFVSGVFVAPFVWWQARRRPEIVRADNTLAADRHGIRIAAAYGGGAWKWSLFKRVREIRGFLVLDMQIGQGFVIPVDAFDTPNLTAFRRLLVDAGFSPDGKPIERA
jgi:hypothetical protein